MQHAIHGDQVADLRDPAQDGPTVESIARARAAQQRERVAFTETTGVRLTDHGQLDWRGGTPGRRAARCH